MQAEKGLEGYAKTLALTVQTTEAMKGSRVLWRPSTGQQTGRQVGRQGFLLL